MEVERKGIDSEEESYLNFCLQELKAQIKELSQGLEIIESKQKNFKRYLFKERGNMNPVEIRSNMLTSDMEAHQLERKANYLQKLYRIQKAPYFGRIDFKEDGQPLRKVYISITHLTKDFENYIYDWRSPIASLFYDESLKETSYQAPRKRSERLSQQEAPI